MDGNSSYERRIYQLIINEVTERSSCNIYIRSGGGINCEEKISEKKEHLKVLRDVLVK